MIVRYLLLFAAGLLLGQAAIGEEQVDITGIHYYQEPDASSLSLKQAQLRFKEGDFTYSKQRALTFGIIDQAIWVRIAVENLTDQTLTRRLTAGHTWLEQVQVFHIAPLHIQTYTAGDGLLADEHLLPAVGLVFYLDIPTGESEIWLRVQSLDPITLPIRLLSPEQAQHSDSWAHLGSGLLYGVLLALAGFQLVLYGILKHRNALFYSIYIGTFVIMNFGYSGYGFAWLYPHSPTIQNYSTLFFMVLHAICGLVFMRNFLQLKQLMPLFARGLSVYMVVGVLVMTLFVILQSHFFSALWSFGYITLTTLLMITTSAMCLNKVEDARYFLLAIGCSMIGLCITSLSNLGILPYTKIGYHGAEIGVVCEAIILAIVVTNRLKAIEDERTTAKFLATYDPLTKLYNRHAFEESATKLFYQAKQQHSTLSFAILDLDFFKAINDRYGHQVGDLALKHIATLLKQSVRTNDVVARWGGEEMVVLMPYTSLAQAFTLMENVRHVIETSEFTHDGSTILMTASIGIAISDGYDTPEQLFVAADARLYLAKDLGRNRVEFVLAED